jgi:transposase-like protein
MNLAERAVYDEDASREWFEQLRWPDGPVCPHCGERGKVYRLLAAKDKRQVLKCASCRKQFSVTVGTIFEDSHIPLHKWLMAFHLYCSSKKGMSAHQLHRTLEITYKSAWFMAHRIRYCMGESPLREKLQGIVEADEMYVGGKEKNKHLGKRNPKNLGGKGKAPVVALVQGGGNVRSFAADVTTEEPAFCINGKRYLGFPRYDGLAEPLWLRCQAIHQSRNGRPCERRICAGRCAHEHDRERVRDLQTWRVWDVSPHQQTAPTPLSCGV